MASQTLSGLLERWDSEIEVLWARQMVQLRAASAGSELFVPVSPDGSVDSIKAKRPFHDRQDGLQLQLTTHRIVLWKQQQQQSQQQAPRFMALEYVLQCSAETLFLKSPKILLNTFSGDFLLGFPSASHRDEVLTAIQKTLQRQAWKQSTTNLPPTHPSISSTRRVGVDAIMAHQQRQLQRHKHITATALEGDADVLLQEASELVQMIHKYVATLEHHGDGDSTNNSNNNNQELVQMLQDMGMTSAIARKSDFPSALRYYQQLARQLCDYLHPKLVSSGGVMTLTDAYCWFNRARSSNLVSPEDFRQAAECLADLHLGIQVKTFAQSGLMVLQTDQWSDPETVYRPLLREGERGLNELEAARVLNLSAVLAKEQLLAAEQLGLMVRDERVEMVQFFPNRFKEWADELLPVANNTSQS